MRVIAVLLVALVVGCGGSRPPPSETRVETAGPTWSDELITRELDARRDALSDCASGVESFALDLEIAPSGRLDGISVGGELDAMQNQCVRDALAHFDLPGDVGSGREHTARIDATSATEQTALEGELRGFLDARRATILACALEMPVVIEVEWNGTGAVVYHLRGRAATDRERCVIDALASGAPDTAGSVGAIVHELR